TPSPAPTRARWSTRSDLLAYEPERQAGDDERRRKIGRKLLPVHRNATTSPSAAWKVPVRPEFRPLRIRRVCRPGTTGTSIVSFILTDPTLLPSTSTSYGPRRTSTPMDLWVSCCVAAIVGLLPSGLPPR